MAVVCCCLVVTLFGQGVQTCDPSQQLGRCSNHQNNHSTQPYKVHPRANLALDTAEARAFASEFPGLILPEVLSFFTGTHTIEQIGRLLPQVPPSWIDFHKLCSVH